MVLAASSSNFSMMTIEERLLLEALCAQIAAETDNRKFGELVQELIKLLERTRQKAGNPPDSRAVPHCWTPKAMQVIEL